MSTEGGITDLKRFLDVLVREVQGIINVLPRCPRDPLETGPRKPFWDCRGTFVRFLWRGTLLAGTCTDGENFHEKGAKHQGDVNSSHRFLGRRKEPIAPRFCAHPVRDRQGQRQSKASRPKDMW